MFERDEKQALQEKKQAERMEMKRILEEQIAQKKKAQDNEKERILRETGHFERMHSKGNQIELLEITAKRPSPAQQVPQQATQKISSEIDINQIASETIERRIINEQIAEEEEEKEEENIIPGR